MKTFLLMIMALLLIAGSAVFAVPSQQPPVIAKVGIHLMSIDQLDLYKGTYAMDYHVSFNCNTVCPKFSIEVLNGTNSIVDEEESTPNQKIFRIKSNLQANFDATNYPFDYYDLKLELKDHHLDKRKLILVADPNAIIVDPKIVLHGWQSNLHASARVENVTHPLIGNTFSKYIFMIELHRPLLMGFLKVLFPAMIIMFFAFISFIIRPNPTKAYERIAVVSGSLLASILFHLNLTSTLPPLGYLTYVDMMMIINYFILLTILFENVYVLRLVEGEKLEAANRIDKKGIIIILLFWLLLQTLNAFIFFVW